MANVLVRESSLEAIADAIREKLNVQTTYKPSEMANAIESISGGGITPTGTIEITQNGVVDVTNYASADVDVPQGTTPTGTKQISITQNGTTTEDVTNYASAEITVNVSGGGSSGLTLLDTITVSSHSVQIDINSSWLSTYKAILLVPNITLSANDWVYMINDVTSGGKYTEKITTFDSDYTTVIGGLSNSKRYIWQHDSSVTTGSVTSYLYFYTYTSSVTMSGTFTIYGVSI